jgi:D-3-phosphoglycerate dehydrogenase / 2-oxoglutarate reductase
LIGRNYDEPGKIGIVGGRLGKAGVNIRSMSVAPIEIDTDGDLAKVDSAADNGAVAGQKEALMILGVDRAVDDGVRKSLIGEDGLLEASIVVL